MVFSIKVDKTVYAPHEATDGKRILVMRLWPRGIRKTSVDLWMKELGTSRELIREWKSGRIKWGEFNTRFRQEMKGENQKGLIQELAHQAQLTTITLLCSCKDPSRCHRGILKELVEAQFNAVK